ncbi:arylesterase [Neptunomonas japonica]|uniref:GDSL family lipase n=1 Tax=Neptunomonas japonica JAMM 1380 TaxID=1441457 RepID=A0A7R6PXL3_9GAMM|nr:arylesterase [Neptunomonas japonica]BBB31423.1 GDSL family lipase [Neptunomonas japonica JAMM 1380]
MAFIRYLLLLSVIVSSSVSARTLLVLGDSLSAAYGIRPEQGWVALLETRLQQGYTDIDVVNASISGETTQGGITRLPALIERHQPDWIVLELAANDGLRGMPLALIQRNITQLIELSEQASATPLLVGIRLPPNYGVSYTERFYSLFETLADEYEVSRVPFLLEGVALQQSLMQADGLHPNAKAQAVLLDNVWPYLQPLLGD